MKKIVIRSIAKRDIKEVLSIYNYYIENSLGNFEENKVSLGSFTKLTNRIISKNLPFTVCCNDKSIIGFAYLQEYRKKSGYRFTYENSIYVHKDYTDKGIGNLLLKNLIKISKKNKMIKNIIAVIGDSKNYSSIKIHENNGFKKIGRLKKVGFKKNKWIDSIYMQKEL